MAFDDFLDLPSDDLPFYEKDGLLYPRVSTILSETLKLFHPKKYDGFEWWRKNYEGAEEILATAKIRGSLVHAEIENWLSSDHDGDCSMISSMGEIMQYSIFGYMYYLEPLLAEIKAENHQSTLLMEQRIFCEHGFTCKPDLRCYYKGKFTLFDWKSLRSQYEKNVKKEYKPPSKFREGMVQGCGYALAHNIQSKIHLRLPEIEEIAIVACYDWTSPELFFLTGDERKKYTNEFIDRFQAYQEISQTTYPMSEGDL